jgi:asparagine synthase (glutamine-hydrolysing)
MLGAIRHRGPDQFGLYLDDQVGLGNARLSILDLKTGQQPIGNEDGTLWIVFNGELFNHTELRANLEGRGHRFQTTSDTETVLHAYEAFGPACVSRFNGQFALAIWNAQERSLFLARDRLGVRPLFYTVAGGALLFGSEIKAILAHPLAVAEMDPGALDEIFTYWSTLSPRTFFRGIQELPPGHFLLAKDGALTLEKYWETDFPAPGPRRGLQGHVEELEELLTDATRIRLRADVPVGAYLSGGLDSSIIASLIQKHSATPLETFSISFDEPAFDESPFQQEMARHLGTRHHVVHTTCGDIGRVFPEVIWHTETPLMRTSPAPMFLLSRFVRERRFKVVLTGEGADEFFAGYDIFKEAKIRRFWAGRPDSLLRPALLHKIYPWIAGLTKSEFTTAFFGHGLLETASRDYSHHLRWRTTARAKRFFSRNLAERIREAGPAAGPRFPEGFDGWEPLHKAQFLEISIFLSQYLLSSQGDRMAMGNSVEGRYPFLDHRVVAYSNALPPTLKLFGLKEKYLLKALGRKWLPPGIVDRPKQPFRAPIHRAFFGANRPEYLDELLSPGSIRRAGFFEPEAVARLVAKAEQGATLGEGDDMALAGVISTMLVERQFLSSFTPAAPLGAADDIKVVLRTKRPKGARPCP